MEEPTSNQGANINQPELAKEVKNRVITFLYDRFDFRDDTDHEETIKDIKVDIPFKGATAWVLIFAVFVASIGLNADSTAVVIGAMLISPLMGPILGLGMSFALNDIDTFKKSLINLGVMIGLSLFASFMFFYFFPLSEDTSELLGRTKPDIRDVLIAFFGGLALMVAKTKKRTIASVVFGVAIATALMPPLCTAGYGLAKGNFPYFFGAMYLFTINTIFIALAGFVVLKMLRFPMHKYANSRTRKRYATIATVLGIAVMIPAIFTFIRVFEESQIERAFNEFVKSEVKQIPNFQLIGDPELDIPNKEIRLRFFNEVTEGESNLLSNQLNDDEYTKIKDFSIKIKGSDTKSFELITTAYKEKRDELQQSKNIIAGLQKQIASLEETILGLNDRIEKNAQSESEKVVAFSRVAKEAKIRYIDIQEIGFANILNSKDFIKIDTIPQAFVKWNPAISDSIIDSKEKAMQLWLQKELQLDTIFIKREK
ncbi:MAG: TIGR00341 family protein [Flavobacteriaceae bacterium]|nr:TIGR00341 family protein [Flavobacteriaceae bacterium]|tara:strand:- start:125068 stop:126519 length:1452 start_codon:yes stop_codon:yes gene_type:complete